MLEPLKSFQDKIHPLSPLLCVCVCVRPVSCPSPQANSVICVTSQGALLERGRRVPCLLVLTTCGWTERRGDGSTDGRRLPNEPLSGRLLVEISTLICLVYALALSLPAPGERGRQVRLSVCVFNNRSNRGEKRGGGRMKVEAA